MWRIGAGLFAAAGLHVAESVSAGDGIGGEELIHGEFDVAENLTGVILAAAAGALLVGHAVIIHRHQKQLVDAQLLQIGDLFCQSHKGALVPHSGILILRKASHMKMIKDPLLIGNFRMAVIFPVIGLKGKATPKGRNASLRIPLPEILPA